MKITLILWVTIWLSFFQNCFLKQDVPEEVIEAFESKFTEATHISWEAESPDEWEVEFRMDGNNLSSLFHKDGKWLTTEYDFPIIDLPSRITKALESWLDEYHIEEVEFVESEIGPFYEIELEKLGKEMQIKVDTAGNVLEKITGDDD